MDARTRMLGAAEALLLESTECDISTRAVCEAAGVGAPVLYRLFGDKNGLVAAVVDRAFDRYLASKRAQKLSDDPVADLYSTWDLHIDFALKNQAVYRTAYAPALATVPPGVEKARQLLVDRLVRCAEVGRLTMTPDQAAQVMMAAATGVALSLISQPSIFSDPVLSRRVRDSVLGELVAQTVPPDRRRDPVKSVALQMAALVRANRTPLTDPELALMLQWLGAISSATDTARSTRSASTSARVRPGRRPGST
jgi:AcrR family transcriptional regulator